MRARDRIARPKSLMCLSPADRRGDARLEAPSSRSIADSPGRVPYAAGAERREDGSAHRGKASRVGRGGLPDDKAPKRAGARLSLLASFARALLAALCFRPNLLHVARRETSCGTGSASKSRTAAGSHLHQSARFRGPRTGRLAS